MKNPLGRRYGSHGTAKPGAEAPIRNHRSDQRATSAMPDAVTRRPKER